MNETITRPEFCTDAMLNYLDELRKSGITNMFGAGPYLDKAFPNLRQGYKGSHSSRKSRDVLVYWMKTFGKDR